MPKATVDHHGLAIEQITTQLLRNKTDFAASTRNACEGLRQISCVRSEASVSIFFEFNLCFAICKPNPFRGSRAFTDSENQLQTPLSPEGTRKSGAALRKEALRKGTKAESLDEMWMKKKPPWERKESLSEGPQWAEQRVEAPLE